MNPTAMLILLVGAHAAFFWSAHRRWQLLQVGIPKVGIGETRLDRLMDRAAGTWRYAFKQEKMDYYQPSGLAHKLIFVGFLTLLFRTIVLWGRGFYPSWNLFVLGPWMPLGKVYEFAKDIVGVLVLIGVSIFFYFRARQRPKRMSFSKEGTLILVIIATMMIADMTYDGAAAVLTARNQELCGIKDAPAICSSIATIIAPYQVVPMPGVTMPVESHALGWSLFPSPAGSAFAVAFKGLPPAVLVALSHSGFWIHSGLVLLFLNLLPHSKHFHVITAIFNVFLRTLDPPGRLRPMAENAEKLMEVVGAAGELPDPTSAPVGIARLDHFNWKSLLDFYTCTECGRCSDNCPAHRTGKILSPKHLLLAMRDHLYENESLILERPETDVNGAGDPGKGYTPIDLVPNVVHPDVLWACTSCRACEEQCPVMISYVDKIIDMRRNLVLVRGEFPHTLQKPFQGMEVNGNPWNLSRMDRAGWADGLGIPTMAEKPEAEILFWVGCAASYDDRAKKIARATAKLMKQAGVDFAILAQEENCTGDPARRAGNEFLFAMLAEGNVATLNGYKEKGGMKQVVTTCPHCFNTLKNEYPDFGAKLEVVHHTDFLLGLLAEKKLIPVNPVEGGVVYHDSCYLGRYNGVYESPREILRRIPGVELKEAEYWTKQRGLCCGAGGGQMFMEEQNTNRVNVKRTLQLVDTQAKTIASACPFCMTMLSDGLKSQNLEEKIAQLDVAELLEKSCHVHEAATLTGPGAGILATSEPQEQASASAE